MTIHTAQISSVTYNDATDEITVTALIPEPDPPRPDSIRDDRWRVREFGIEVSFTAKVSKKNLATKRTAVQVGTDDEAYVVYTLWEWDAAAQQWVVVGPCTADGVLL